MITKQATSPNLNNVNTNPRTKAKKKWGLFTSKPADTPLTSEDKDRLIFSLRNEITQKDAALEAMASQINRLENEMRRQSIIVHRKHPLNTHTHLIHDEGTTKTPLATRGSVATANALRAFPEATRTPAQRLADKFISAFQNPVDYMNYLQSREFASDIVEVCDAVCEILEEEPRCLFMQSPVYVMGDIHGNLEDLHFFADNLWKPGIELSAGKFLFLGDYVDRGLSSLECVAYLMANKLLHPKKVHMLRGNHETRSVNGWEEHYGEKSFLHQCKKRFGLSTGENVWEEVNQVFDRLPLAAVIDHDIFCIHGGIPRPVPDFENAIQAILAVPNVIGINPCYEHETEWTIRVASDCIWSDPAQEDMEEELDEDGFGPSLRGGDCVCFGMPAIEEFLQTNNLSFIVRAHEAHAHGVSLSKAAKVFTVFSTSKDHGQGKKAMAGCILADCDKIQVINRSPAYKNKYVHHRTSVGVHLTEDQLGEMAKLGLLRMDSDAPRRSRSNSRERKEEEEESKNTKTMTHVVSFDEH